MSQFFNPHVSGTRGGVHTGSGDQTNNNYYFVAGLFSDSAGRSPRRVAEDDLDWLHQRFVHPTGFADAREILATRNMVLLDGPPGSGRTSTARMLLHELRSDAGTLHELPPEAEAEKKARDLDSIDIGDHDRLLLDFSNTGERFWADIQSQLPGFRQTIMAHEASLVVVLPKPRVTPFPPELRRYQAPITAPLSERVLQRYLRRAGLPADETIELPAVLSDFLSRSRPPREIAELAELIDRARGTESGGGGFHRWCELACAAATDRADEVAQLVTRLRRGPQRALLLATAMLHEAHSDAVHDGTTALLKAVHYPRDERSVLERADLVQRLERIKAKPDPHGRVRFTDLEYDTAIRNHFWRYLPELREPVRAWVSNAIGTPRMTRDDRDTLVKRFAEQCLSTGDQEQLAVLVTDWTSTRAPDRLRAAAKALEHGLQNEQYGGFFRQRIYHWSLGSPGTGLTEVLVGVCAEVMAVRHPDQALVRLHHLARRQRSGTTAHEALLRLTARDRRLYRLMLARLASTPADHPTADIDLFLALADPASLTDASRGRRPLVVDKAVRGHLARGWNTAFDTRPHQDWRAQAVRWLEAACEAEWAGDLLLNVLVEGCGARGDHFGRLYVTARDWESGTVPELGSRAVAARLRQKIDAAQGYNAA